MKFWYICCALVFPAVLSAQTAARMDVLLQTEAVSYGEAARFVLEAADKQDFFGDEAIASPAGAFRLAREQRWLPENISADGSASLEIISLLIMQSFDMKGGLFYSVFKTPHYAYRDLVYQEIIDSTAEPEMTVSGEMLLFMINRVLAVSEEDTRANYPLAKLENKIREKIQDKKRNATLKKINTRLASVAIPGMSTRITGEGVTIAFSALRFEANSSILPEAEKEKLRELGSILETVSARKLLIGGHTALAGTSESRQQTSRERAEAVRDYFISLGVREAGEIAARGYGAEQPIAENSTPEGMALNRRVEITIVE